MDLYLWNIKTAEQKVPSDEQSLKKLPVWRKDMKMTSRQCAKLVANLTPKDIKASLQQAVINSLKRLNTCANSIYFYFFIFLWSTDKKIKKKMKIMELSEEVKIRKWKFRSTKCHVRCRAESRAQVQIWWAVYLHGQAFTNAYLTRNKRRGRGSRGDKQK